MHVITFTYKHATSCIERINIVDYKKAYALLVGIMSETIDELEKSQIISRETEVAILMLKEGLEIAEEMYIFSG